MTRYTKKPRSVKAFTISFRKLLDNMLDVKNPKARMTAKITNDAINALRGKK